jgi:hypothetical protein
MGHAPTFEADMGHAPTFEADMGHAPTFPCSPLMLELLPRT